MDPGDAGVTLVHGIIPRQTKMGIDPEGDPGFARFVGDHRDDRPVEDFCRVEDVVDLFALDQTVDMNAGPCYVEIGSHKREIRRYPDPDLFFKIAGNIGNHCRIDPMCIAAKADVLDDQPLQRGIARPFPQAEKRRVGCCTAIEPGSGGVDHGLVKIVMAVPFQEVAGDLRILDEGPDELVYAPRQGCSGKGDAVPHRVAESDLDIDPAFLPEFHQFDGEGYTETVYIRPSYILEVAAGNDACIED